LLVAVALLLAVVGYFWLRGRQAPKDEVAYHFICPSCKRRLRYYAKQAGHSGQCPRCRHTLTFPRKPS
jgi:hypothetical protein